MTNPTLERAARAVQDEIERQVAEPGYLGWGVGQEDHRPPLAKTYVDGDLDVSALARAVLMAVREPELNDGGGDIYRAGFEAMFDAKFKDEYSMMSTGWEAMIDAILGGDNA